ncbi:DUF4192 domain-containing protein [Goodfellowiella coeruleoviolacea]|uniref:DUF4192 domain-containing protein n=1 Tax=Goodfellowiella coeruleoviolacea TaxID=334858 RepID=A0AAE3GJ15_9PSEU|nr:DUF4192 domain-containing protein [Goodfellowiella coeruleoviolacea]MCP2168390.1 protein of unknown function (DUF4192) [Goodfellowiella coeruleoviolacea]
MNAPSKSRIRLRDPGELIAAVPHLLGFHPTDSVVLIATKGGTSATKIAMTLRMDLPGPQHREAIPDQLVLPLHQQRARAAAVLVVGGGQPRSALDLPHRQLVHTLDGLLCAADIAVIHALWVSRIAADAAWHCYDDQHCHGTVPDPGCTVLAATSAAAGLITFGSRAELAAQLAPAAPDVLARRSARLAVAVEAAEAERARAGPTRARRDLVAVREVLARWAHGETALTDDDVVRLAVALTDARVRDACLASCAGDQAEVAERLWTALARATPPPERAEPATLLAFCAYLRGEGSLASVALEQADLAHPGHRLAGLLRAALDTGLPPDRLATLVADAATDAAHLLGPEHPPGPPRAEDNHA